MTQQLEKQLALDDIGITGKKAVDIGRPPFQAAAVLFPAAVNKSKLSEGWVNTSQGDVFISPGGVAWVVERRGDALVSVPVKLSKDDIIGKSAAERRAESIQKQTRRARTRVLRTMPPLQPLQRVPATANEGFRLS